MKKAVLNVFFKIGFLFLITNAVAGPIRPYFSCQTNITPGLSLENSEPDTKNYNILTIIQGNSPYSRWYKIPNIAAGEFSVRFTQWNETKILKDDGKGKIDFEAKDLIASMTNKKFTYEHTDNNTVKWTSADKKLTLESGSEFPTTVTLNGKSYYCF